MVKNQHEKTPNPMIVPVFDRRGELEKIRAKKQIAVEMLVRVRTGEMSERIRMIGFPGLFIFR